MTRRFLLVTMLAATAAAAAQQPTLAPLAGRYQLIAIDGHAIPYAARDPHAPPSAPPAPEVVASTLVIRPDGSFMMAMAYRSGSGAAARISVNPFSGTCRAEGNAYIARWEGAGETRLELSADTLTLDNSGLLFSYRRLR